MALTQEQKIMVSGCLLAGCALNTIGSLVTLLWVTGSAPFVWTLPKIALVIDAGSGAVVTATAYQLRKNYKKSVQSMHSIDLGDPAAGEIEPHASAYETVPIVAPVARRPVGLLTTAPDVHSSPYGTTGSSHAVQLTASYAASPILDVAESDVAAIIFSSPSLM